jgi:hypothetical protein
MKYKLHNRFDENSNKNILGGILRFNDDNTITSIPINHDNTDYQAYLKWLNEGNTPLPADE